MLAHPHSEADELKRFVEESWEIGVEVTHDLDDALGTFHKMQPDLIVIDHDQAAQFLDHIRQDRGPDHFLPILVMISEENAQLKRDDVMAGATDFLAKPVDRSVLAATLAKWLKPETLEEPRAAVG